MEKAHPNDNILVVSQRGEIEKRYELRSGIVLDLIFWIFSTLKYRFDSSQVT